MFKIKSLEGYEATYRERLTSLTKSWAVYRKTKDKQQLHDFVKQCKLLASEISGYPLVTIQQLIKSINLASEKQLLRSNNNPIFIKEVDWLMNQLIRGQVEGNNIFLLDLPNRNSQEQKPLAPNETHDRTYRPSIAIIDDQVSTSQLLCNNLKDFAFEVSSYTSTYEFEQKADFNNIDLVLLDLVMPNISEAEVFEFATKLIDKGIKVISCSSKFTFETRLLAVRAKVSDFAVKPVNTYELVEKIGRVLRLQNQKNHRVVIVDDQETMGEFYKALLEQVGCEVTFFTSGQLLFESLEELNPDMFLLDMMMPDVDGLEVAKMIRQEHKFDFAPIIFLTADELIENRLAAIDAGADDVINKMSSSNTVTTQVITRLNRASVVRTFVGKDPLTGVLNHGRIIEDANHSMRLSQRRKTISALAVIDVDLFKNVNDTYGHITGDRVLCALGQLMTNSVRETDSVGRYGGEEFVIVFDDCSIEDAAAKVQKIKDVFGSMKFAGTGLNFNVTFSAGVVNLSDYDNVQTAIGFADKALYKAKEEGRNKIILYGKSSQ